MRILVINFKFMKKEILNLNSSEGKIGKLEGIFKRMAGLESYKSEYKRGHGIYDHSIFVAQKSKKFAEMQGLDKNEIFAYFIAGLNHYIIQPEQTVQDSDLEKEMIKAWNYQGKGEDVNEEIESARFVEWYLEKPHVIKKMKEYGISLDKKLKERIISAIENTAGKIEIETGMFKKPNGELVNFKDIDKMEQAVYLSDKMTGAEPSLIFDGLSKLTNLYLTTSKVIDKRITEYILEKFEPHITQRANFFEMLKKSDQENELGLTSLISQKEFKRLNQGVELQQRMLEQLNKDIDLESGPVLDLINLIVELIKEKIKIGDERGINGFKVIEKWYLKIKDEDKDEFTKELLLALRNQPELRDIFKNN